MRFFRKHGWAFIGAAGWLPEIWRWIRRGLELGEHTEFISEHISWVRKIMEIPVPPWWIGIPLLIGGIFLVWWDLRRTRSTNESEILIGKNAIDPVSVALKADLRRARDDLLSIPKSELSFQKLSQWQSRASAATRLAHATGINLHNPISHYVGAVHDVTDIERLNIVRERLAQMIADIAGQ